MYATEERVLSAEDLKRYTDFTNHERELYMQYAGRFDEDEWDGWLRDAYLEDYNAWKNRYNGFLNKRTTHKDGRSYYLHRKLRTAVNSIEFYLPYLYTYQREEQDGMPNTNNKIEEAFTDL